MRFWVAVISLGLVSLVGCGDDHGGHASHAVDDHDGQQEASSAQGSADGLSIRLNDGSKWEMDEHTRSKFADMSDAMDSSLSGDELGEKLQGDLDQLIAGCTMTGEAHNQLHVYLVELIPAVKGLRETGSPESESKVRRLLEVYPEYFR